MSEINEFSTIKVDGEVKLHMRESGVGSFPPLTMHETLHRMSIKYKDVPALVSCNGFVYTYSEYYDTCRKYI